MAEVIRVRLKNHVHLKIDTDPGIMAEMRDHFSFRVDGYQFTPKYKSGAWDGYIRLLNGRTGELYAGLYDSIVEFANAKGRDYVVEPIFDNYFGLPNINEEVDEDTVKDWIESLNLVAAGGKKIDPHDFQIKAVLDSIRDRRKVIISPTRSGKSLIIYSLIRYIVENELPDGHKIVLIVPRTSLVKQMFSDFEEYSSLNGWDVDAHCHQVVGGVERKTKKPIVISTWQSFIKFPEAFSRGVYALFGDEAHNFKAQSLTTIMERLVNAPWRIGTTGTLDGSKVNRMVLEGLFGPVQKMTSTKELMDRGIVSKLNIDVLLLEYSEATRRSFGKKKYHDEIAFINSHERRNNFIRNLALSLDGNTIVAFKETLHGKYLYELIKEAAHERRKIFFVAGETDTDTREAVRKLTEKEKNAIIVASMGVFSEGITIRNLHNVIFARPTKSQITVPQMLGRSLGIADDGKPANLYDIADDLHWRGRTNYTLKHSAERIKLYTREQFVYKIHKIKLEE